MASGVESSAVALINIAHTDRNPAHTRAAFRVLGFFASAGDAQSHIAAVGSDVDAFTVPTHRWIALATSRDVNEEDLLTRLGREHQKRIKHHDDEFSGNVHEQRTGEANRRNEVVLACDTDPSRGLASRAAPVGRNAEVRMQRFAVVSIINDASTTDVCRQQPAVLFWCACETEDEAREKIRTDYSIHVKDVTLDVVAMYEWLNVPTYEESATLDEEWRDPKLNEIMTAKKQQGARVRGYEEECRREGRDPKVIEIQNCPETDDHARLRDIPLDPPVVDVDSVPPGVTLMTLEGVAEGERVNNSGYGSRSPETVPSAP